MAESGMKYLQGWMAMVGLMALGNTVSCFTDHGFLANNLYTRSADFVNPLLARTFGVWTLLSALLRIYCAIHITNAQVYNMTLLSFLLTFCHFVLEVFVYKTAAITAGTIMSFLVSGISIIAMLLGYWFNPAFNVNKPARNVTSRRTLKEELLIAQKTR